MIMVAAAGTAYGEAPPPDSTDKVPVAIDKLTLTDDLIVAIGGRAITDRRVEALVGTGSDATHRAAVRATDRLGPLDFELIGTTLASDVVQDQSDAAARIEHHGERNAFSAYGRYGTEHVPTTQQSFTTDVDTTAYGATWTTWRAAGRFELQAFGEQSDLHDEATTSELDLESTVYSARVGFASRRVQALDLDHELGAGITVVDAKGEATKAALDPAMPTPQTKARARRGHHRFVSAYINDTLRVIDSLDITGGFVFEHWRWLSSMHPLAQGEEAMDLQAPETISSLIGPRVHAMYRMSRKVAFEATAYRRLRTPTWPQLMRPVQNGSVLTTPDGDLHAETVTGGEVGPVIATGSIEARAVGYWNEIGTPIATVTIGDTLRETTNLDGAREAGVEATASWRFAKPWLAGVGYAFTHAYVTAADAYPQLVGKQLPHTPRHRASAMLVFDQPRLVTVTGVVHYVGQRFEDDRNEVALRPTTIVDAMATRKITHGLAGFVAVENLMDRRYVANVAGVDTFGAPRMVHVGLRLDSARW